MKFLKSILMAAAILMVCAGCVSFEPGKFEQQVRKWVPVGTPEKVAERVMKRHGFECTLVSRDNRFNKYDMDYLDCSKVQVWFHDWNAQLLLQDGRVAGYGATTVE